MSRIAIPALLVLVAAIAWVVRADEGPLVDPASTSEMRRIQLAVASGDVPGRDRWLDGVAGPLRPALFAHALAALAQRTLADTSPDRTLRGIDAERLEELARGAVRAAAALVPLALFAALAASLAGPRRRELALGAAALLALLASARAAPVATTAIAQGLALAGFAAALAAFRARSFPDTVLCALSAGVAFGFAIGFETEAACALFAATSAALWGALSGEREEAQRGSTIALAQCAGAAVIGVLTHFGAREDFDAYPATHVQIAVIALAVVAFACKHFAGLQRSPSWLGQPLARAAAALLPLAAWLVWCGAELEFHPSYVLRRAIAGLAFALVLCALLLRRRDHTSIAWAAFALASAPLLASGASPVHFTAALLGALAMALERAGSSTRALRACGAFALAAVLVLELECRAARAPYAAPETARALVERLTWMREHAPYAGPWNHAQLAPDWTVLCEPELGPAVAYHARRPPYGACLEGRLASAEAQRARERLHPDGERALEELTGFMNQARAPWLLAGSAAIPRWLAAEIANGTRAWQRAPVIALATGATPAHAALQRALGDANVALLVLVARTEPVQPVFERAR